MGRNQHYLSSLHYRHILYSLLSQDILRLLMNTIQLTSIMWVLFATVQENDFLYFLPVHIHFVKISPIRQKRKVQKKKL